MTTYRLSTGETLSHYCRTHCLNYGKVVGKVKRGGYHPDEAIKPSVKGRVVAYRIKGKTVGEYAKHIGKSKTQVYRYIYQGTVKVDKRETPFFFVEKQHPIRLSTGETLHKYCLRNGISYATVLRNIEVGVPPEEAIKIPPRKIAYTIEGKTVEEFAKKAGISRSYAYDLVYKGKIKTD